MRTQYDSSPLFAAVTPAQTFTVRATACRKSKRAHPVDGGESLLLFPACTWMTEKPPGFSPTRMGDVRLKTSASATMLSRRAGVHHSAVGPLHPMGVTATTW